MSARDLQFKDGQWLRGKGFDSFCPVPPRIVSVDELGEAEGLRIVQRLNGAALQDSTTSDLIFGIRALVAHASTVFTLEPGDLILTGTPAGVGIFRKPPVALADGDEVESRSRASARSGTRSCASSLRRRSPVPSPGRRSGPSRRRG